MLIDHAVGQRSQSLWLLPTAAERLLDQHAATSCRQILYQFKISQVCRVAGEHDHIGTSIGNRPLAKIIPGVAGDLTGQVAPPRLVTLRAAYDF